MPLTSCSSNGKIKGYASPSCLTSAGPGAGFWLWNGDSANPRWLSSAFDLILSLFLGASSSSTLSHPDPKLASNSPSRTRSTFPLNLSSHSSRETWGGERCGNLGSFGFDGRSTFFVVVRGAGMGAGIDAGFTVFALE
jgi:hypothetical protein